MGRFKAARDSVAVSAQCLAAFLHNEEGIDADAGALVLADAVDCLRVLRSAFTKRRKGPRG